MRTFTLALFMLCGADGLSQNLTETFGYPAGTNIPNWIEQRGDCGRCQGSCRLNLVGGERSPPQSRVAITRRPPG